jgi:hypothetical protein
MKKYGQRKYFTHAYLTLILKGQVLFVHSIIIVFLCRIYPKVRRNFQHK